MQEAQEEQISKLGTITPWTRSTEKGNEERISKLGFDRISKQLLKSVHKKNDFDDFP